MFCQVSLASNRCKLIPLLHSRLTLISKIYAIVPNTSFTTLPLLPALQDTLQALGFEQMTPIQQQSLPLILKGQDVIAQAKTGSGKTAAFGLGVLQKLNPSRLAVQALILCPTRELADQVANELRRLARQIPNVRVLTVCGGVATRPQTEALQRGVHIVVGTPGRVQDHLNRGNLDLSALQMLVLDEADRMVDMGFQDELTAIAEHCPKKRQTLLFSATYPENIQRLSARYLRNPEQVKVESLHDAQHIEQIFYEVHPDKRPDTVVRLLMHYRPSSTLVFCNTKMRCQEVLAHLQSAGMHAQTLHGDMEQRERDEILIQFANQSYSVLVATDVASRGLDLQNLSAVINADISKDAEVHVHRVGRSGRGEQKGLALSLCSHQESRWVELIEQYQGYPIKFEKLSALRPQSKPALTAPMITLHIQGGKKDKLRPGDLLGALTGDGGLKFEDIGKIHINDYSAYVALKRSLAHQAFDRINTITIKGRRFRMRLLDTF